MSEMVERVAKAIMMAGPPDDLKTRARAAIAAMREPTDEMIAVMALYDFADTSLDTSPYAVPFAEDAKQCWREMIDEALK